MRVFNVIIEAPWSRHVSSFSMNRLMRAVALMRAWHLHGGLPRGRLSTLRHRITMWSARLLEQMDRRIAVSFPVAKQGFLAGFPLLNRLQRRSARAPRLWLDHPRGGRARRVATAGGGAPPPAPPPPAACVRRCRSRPQPAPRARWRRRRRRRRSPVSLPWLGCRRGAPAAAASPRRTAAHVDGGAAGRGARRRGGPISRCAARPPLPFFFIFVRVAARPSPPARATRSRRGRGPPCPPWPPSGNSLFP